MVWKLRGLTFASVKGAGHMMPKDKRKEAAVLLDCFLNNKNLPENPNQTEWYLNKYSLLIFNKIDYVKMRLGNNDHEVITI